MAKTATVESLKFVCYISRQGQQLFINIPKKYHDNALVKRVVANRKQVKASVILEEVEYGKTMRDGDD